jgi:pimeloyl-ACP methyl ester carboxylesterase
MPIVHADGADLFYESTGEGDPLLLIMGLGSDSRGWALQVPAFSSSYRVITFDNRGVGKSSAPPEPYSTEQMAGDAAAVLDAAGVERAHVVGVSLGGAIAQHLALKWPERIRSLVLASTWAGPSEWRSRVRKMQLDVAERGRDALIRARLLFIFTPTLFLENPQMISTIEKVMISDHATLDGYLRQVDAAEEHDVRARLAEITAPTLVISSERDILVPPELSTEVARLIPGAELLMLDSAHAVQFEEAQRFNEAVLAFLARS